MATRKLPLTRPAADPRWWALDPKGVLLNHGSFGPPPRLVLEARTAAELERHQRELIGMLGTPAEH